MGARVNAAARRGRLVGVLLAAWVAAAGCATSLGPAIAHEEAELFRASFFDYPRLKSGGLGVLGVTSRVAPDGIRDDVAFVLDQAVTNQLIRIPVVSRVEVLARAKRAGMTDDVKRLIQGYEERGSMDAGLLRRVAAMEGVRYFLITRIVEYGRTTREAVGPPARVATPGLSPPKRGAERVQRVRLRAEVWDSRCGDLVWTGEGATEVVEEVTSEEVRLQDVSIMAVSNLVSRLPRPGEATRAVEKECGV